MIDQSVVDLIAKVVDYAVSNNCLVTAFDITSTVKDLLRKEGKFIPSVHRHLNMKKYVHDAFDVYINNLDYSKNLQNISTNDIAYVFYPYSEDSYAYKTDSFTYVDTPVVTTQSTPNTTQSKDVVLDKIYYAVPDSRGTVCVPAALLKRVGFAPGETAYVYNEMGVIKIKNSVPPNVAEAASYSVDSYTNVRITKFTLSKHNYVYNKYTFSLSQDCTEIRMMGS